MSSVRPALQVVGLTKRFRDTAGERVEVLGCVDFTARPGSLTVVEGVPGSGRTTLLRCLYRTYQPERGRAFLATGAGYTELAGAAATAISWVRRHHVRFYDGSLAAPDRASTSAVLVRNLLRTGVPPAVAERRAVNALSRLALHPDRALRHLDDEERRCVALLLATLPPATAVLLDEPLAGIPDRHHDVVLQFVAEACQRGTAVVATASPGTPLSGLADTVVTLQQGRLV